MKMIEIKAFSYAEAVTIAANEGMKIVKNVTPSYKNAQYPTGDALKALGEKILEKNKLTDAVGVGVMVAVENGTPDVRERPWTLDNKATEGARTSKRVYVVRTKDTDRLVGKAYDKDSAIKLAKNAMATVKEDMVCNIMYEVSDPEAFTLKYTPTAGTTLGTYIVFGNPAE